MGEAVAAAAPDIAKKRMNEQKIGELKKIKLNQELKLTTHSTPIYLSNTPSYRTDHIQNLNECSININAFFFYSNLLRYRHLGAFHSIM